MSNPSEQPVMPDMNMNYKFREVKMYSSDEWMANSTKKYRKVFDRWETTYLRAEISFFNKRFDEADWEVSVRSKCYFINGSQRNELSNYEEKRKVLKDENIVYARHSWGKAEPGDYWRKGNYVWEVYLDEIKVGEAFFYVEDIGQPSKDQNLFFDIESIRLYEGDNQASSLPQKKYLSKFSQKETRYIWCEINIRNKIIQDYYAEIIFLYADSDGQPKGSQSYIAYIQPNTKGNITTIAAGWGNQTTGSWFNDKYTIDILFLDTLIATVPFEVGEVFEEGQAQVITDATLLRTGAPHVLADTGKSKEQILHDSLEELNALTGLEKIKEEVNEMVSLVKYYQEAGKDVLNKFSLHSVFTGNPGTGKTTVARIVSKVYQGLGLLEKGHLVEVDREGLVAGYVGQTAIKTAEKVNEAMGGILFIDEAYALANEKGSPYDFGAESIQVILKRMEDQRGKFGVIVAGYTENMHRFINSNPGLKSRFDKYFHFEDYTPDQMFIIALSMFRQEEVLPDVDAATHLKKYFSVLYDHRDEHFGNARTVRQTVAEAVKNQNLRLAAMPKEQRTVEMISTVVLQDVIEFELKPPAGAKGKIGFKS
jgi:AAA+ superfamily predicted ATPase